MKILAIEKEVPGADWEKFQPHLKDEAARAWELYQAGLFRELNVRLDRSEAVVLMECSDLLEAREAIDSLPLVKAGLIDFELIPLAPYPGFARLFTQEII